MFLFFLRLFNPNPVGAALGQSTATAGGESTNAQAGSALGQSTAVASGEELNTQGAGEAAGDATASGGGASIVAYPGTAAGDATASGVGAAILDGAGSAAGDAQVDGQSDFDITQNAAGTATGGSTASSVIALRRRPVESIVTSIRAGRSFTEAA